MHTRDKSSKDYLAAIEGFHEFCDARELNFRESMRIAIQCFRLAHGDEPQVTALITQRPAPKPCRQFKPGFSQKVSEGMRLYHARKRAEREALAQAAPIAPMAPIEPMEAIA